MRTSKPLPVHENGESAKFVDWFSPPIMAASEVWADRGLTRAKPGLSGARSHKNICIFPQSSWRGADRVRPPPVGSRPALKIYFDTVIASAAVMSDLPSDEMAAVEKLLDAFDDGRIDVETSRLAWDEQDKAKGTIKAKLLAARGRLAVLASDTKLLGVNTTYYEGGFMSAPILSGIMDEALHETFLAAGLKERDAQHLMYAALDCCDRFVTTDQDFLRSRRPILEASCKGLLIKRPSELILELNL